MILLISHILLIIIATFLAIYWCFTKNFNYWMDKNVAYKKPRILFGSLLDILYMDETPTNFLAKLYNEFEEPYVGFFIMNTPYLVLKDPTIINQILVKDFAYFADRIVYNNDKIDPIASNFLLGMKFPAWKTLRSLISPVFSTAKIKMMFILMVDCADNMIEYLNNKTGVCIDAKRVASKYGIDVIGSCAFGINVNSFTDERNSFTAAAHKLFDKRVVEPFAFVFAHALVTIFRLQFFDTGATKFLGEVFKNMFTQRQISQTKRNDLIDILINIKNMKSDDEKYKFDDNLLLAQAILFFAAGFETTSSAIALSLHELAMNQDIQTRLRNEINDAWTCNGRPSYEAVHGLKYLNMVVSETLRKYPITTFIQRECTADYVVPQTGLLIERGSRILISQRGLQWHPTYFPEPEKFDPERFSDKNKAKINHCSYLPFGYGPRKCIGERFGLQNFKVALVMILRNFKVEPNLETKPTVRFAKTLLLHPANGVPLTFRKIEHSS